MLKKTIGLIFLLFLFQLLFSCFSDCNCPGQEKLEAHFNDLETFYEPSYMMVDSVQLLSDFYLRLFLKGTELPKLFSDLDHFQFGFSQALACDCLPPYLYSYNNAIDSVSMILNDSLQMNMEVSSWFYAAYGGDLLYMQQFFQIQEQPLKYYELEMEHLFKVDSLKLSSLPTKFDLAINLFHQGRLTLSDTLIVDITTSEN